MLRHFLSVVLVVLVGSPLAAQEAPHAGELRFVEQLRVRGYSDLALDYLDRLAKQNPSPALLKVLPLEIVKTRLMLADSEQDADKKIALFDQTRKDLDAYQKANPADLDAKLQLARVGHFQGKAQLDRALAMSETEEGRGAEIVKARNLILASAKQIEALIKTLPSADAKNDATLEYALVLMDASRGFVDANNSKENNERAAILKSAITELDKAFTAFAPTNPNRWRAQLWSGRANDLNDDPDKAKKCYTTVFEKGDARSKQLATYFQVLGEHERLLNKTDRKAPDCNLIITTANRWLTTYPRDRNSLEGLGCQWIVARQNYELGKINAANVTARDNYWTAARKIIIDLEQTPTEFASKAQQLKIQILVEQKAFSKKIDELRNFDDLYMRALYEHHQLLTNDKDFSTEDKRKAQQKLVIDILQKGIDRSKTVKVPQHELDMARYLLTGYYYSTGKYKQAAAIGEEYIKSNPKSGNVAVAAVYAAQALNLDLEDRQGAPEAELKPDRDRLFALAKLLIDRWPGEPAGDFGRQLVVLELMRSGKEDEALKLGGDHARFQIGLNRIKENKPIEAIKLLTPIQPTFPQYTQSQYRLAMAAVQCNREKVELPPGEKRTWTDIAIEAFRKVPTPAPNADFVTNLLYVESKNTLIAQLYSQNKFAEMDAVLKEVGDKLDGLKLNDDPEKNENLNNGYRESLETLGVYSAYGKADVAYGKKQFAEATKLLDPIVDGIKDNKYPSLKKAPTLRTGLFSTCLRANIQQSKIQRATQVMDVWTGQTDPADRDKEVMGILGQLIGIMNAQIKELTAENKTEDLAKTKESYAAFLTAMEGQQKMPSLDFTRTMALGYSAVGKYDKAAAILDKLDKPKTGLKTPPDDKEKKLRAARILYLRVIRLEGSDLDKADKEMQEILKDWGAKDINARMEEIHLLDAKKDYDAAFKRANLLNTQLQPLAEKNPNLHASYFEVYYLMCQSRHKFAAEKATGDTKETIRQDAIRLIKNRLDGKVNPELTPDVRERFETLLKEVEEKK